VGAPSGTGSEQGNSIAVDSSGDAYVGGQSSSANFPTVNPVQSSLTGYTDAVVFELNPAGNALLYSTYWGGNNNTYGYGLALDSSSNIYVCGFTSSSNLPTVNPFQAALGGNYNGFVFKLNSAGSAVVFATYLGGSNTDSATGIAVDSAGSAYVAGWTSSGNFPTTGGAFQTVFGSSDNAFVTKFNPAGNTLAYSTYLGGTSGIGDRGSGIAVDSSGDAYVTGYAEATNFPITSGAYQTVKSGGSDDFITKLNPSGSGLVYSTFLGGSGVDNGNGIALDSSGNAYIIGTTQSTNFPMVNAFQPSLNGGGQEVSVSEMNAAGTSLIFSSYLGGTTSFSNGNAIAVDSSGNLYLAEEVVADAGQLILGFKNRVRLGVFQFQTQNRRRGVIGCRAGRNFGAEPFSREGTDLVFLQRKDRLLGSHKKGITAPPGQKLNLGIGLPLVGLEGQGQSAVGLVEGG